MQGAWVWCIDYHKCNQVDEPISVTLLDTAWLLQQVHVVSGITFWGGNLASMYFIFYFIQKTRWDTVCFHMQWTTICIYISPQSYVNYTTLCGNILTALTWITLCWSHQGSKRYLVCTKLVGKQWISKVCRKNIQIFRDLLHPQTF